MSYMQRSAVKKSVRIDLRHAKVLVVDDIQANLEVAAELLRKYGMRVDCVTNGRDAIDIVNRGEPVYDAIFMDYMMPEMDGVETAQAIRAIGTEYSAMVPIIAVTASVIDGSEQMFLERGFQAFLPKPIDVIRLDAILRQWISNPNYNPAYL